MVSLKKLHSYSIIAALVAGAITVIQGAIAGAGIGAIPLAGITMPITYFVAMPLGYPLLAAQSYFKLTKIFWLPIYWIAALVGVVLISLILGLEPIDEISAPWLKTYGLKAFLTSSAVWYLSTYREPQGKRLSKDAT